MIRRPQFTADQLVVFDAVVDRGGINAAAEVLNLAPSTVLHHLRALEIAVGSRLFERSGRSLRPTEAARELGPAIRAANQTLNDIGLLATGIRSETHGTIAVGASQTNAAHYLPIALASFLKERPQVEVELRSGNTREVCEMVSTAEVAIGMVEGPVTVPGLEQVELVSDEVIFVAAHAHPLARRPRLRVEDLGGHRYIAREHGSGTELLAVEALGETYSKLVRVAAGQLEVVRACVAAGLGFAALPRVAVAADLERGRLTSLALPALTRWIRAVRRPAAGGPLLEAFWNHLRTGALS
jgi:DNA-binding transcriptional LysR family regulator